MSAAENPSARAQSERQLDNSTPVTDPKAHSPPFVERFTMLGVEYCVPRIATLEVHKPKDGSPSRGANAALDAETLTNSSPPPWRKGAANAEWSRRVIIDVVPSRPGWGFPGVVIVRTGKNVDDVAEIDLSSIDDIRLRVHSERLRGSLKSDQQFFLRVGGKLILVDWLKTGAFSATYGVAAGVVGSLTVRDEHLDRLSTLIEVASKFFRPCDASASKRK